MQGSDDFPSRRTAWRRFARGDAARRKDLAGFIDEELRFVFSAGKVPPLDGAHRLLKQIEAKRKTGRG
jgi:hypothetical protein